MSDKRIIVVERCGWCPMVSVGMNNRGDGMGFSCKASNEVEIGSIEDLKKVAQYCPLELKGGK